ncbi:prolyl oligopeptidase family serine peptidase [Flavobacterium sp.]|uniref:alpha/beta hydrolase family protein n=1 Tax=Flavobacterium sp. TaxID=239 RepID=UPI00260C521C|nr:prolyl oligopeptidase family serine peptidase [Flavobacterium sp.]
MRLIFIFLCFFMLFMEAHAQKRVIVEEDYRQWETLSLAGVSHDGQWVAYRKGKVAGDTLFICNTKTASLKAYPEAYRAVFSGNDRYVSIISSTNVLLLELGTGREMTIEKVNFLGFSNSSGTAVLHDQAKSSLIIVNTNTLSVKDIKNVTAAALSPKRDFAALVKKEKDHQSVVIQNLDNFSVTTIVAEGARYSQLKWNTPGRAIAFYAIGNDSKNQYEIIAVTRHGKNWKTRNLKDVGPENGQMLIRPSQLAISDDGNTVFHYMQREAGDNAIPVLQNKPSVLNSPSEKLRKTGASNSTSNTFWFAWDLSKGKNTAVETEDYPNAVLTGDKSHALVFKEDNYLPQHKYIDEYIDIKLLCIRTGEIKTFLDKQVYHPEQTLVSPAGGYIAYFRDRQWYVYDIKKDKHKCISNGIPYPVYKTEYDLPGSLPPYGCGGWSEDDSEFYIYDCYDIWTVNPVTGKTFRMTTGREAGIQNRIYDDGLISSSSGRIFGFAAKIVDTPLLIKTINTQNLDEGLEIWDNPNGLRKLINTDRHLFSIKGFDDASGWLFFESDFDQPPVLKVLYRNGKTAVLATSNPQQENFLWGKSELIHYKANGKELKGALFFPADYDPDRKYPMVVNIYERLSHTLNLYIPPDRGSDNGINITHLTAKGYFVLCPDIYYTLNEVGRSSLECVTASVEAATQKYNIDSANIALNGHSFGGYQASYIMGKTDIFSTAIIGAAITDLRSFYLSFNGSGYPNMDLFYSYQFRFSEAFDSEGLLENSPLEHIRNVKAPLLLWTSDTDPVVDYSQTIMFYNALWKLGKPCSLLVYPGEEHSLMERTNQVDLSQRMLEWLDYKLKGSPKPKWAN